MRKDIIKTAKFEKVADSFCNLTRTQTFRILNEILCTVLLNIAKNDLQFYYLTHFS